MYLNTGGEKSSMQKNKKVYNEFKYFSDIRLCLKCVAKIASYKMQCKTNSLSSHTSCVMIKC